MLIALLIAASFLDIFIYISIRSPIVLRSFTILFSDSSSLVNTIAIIHYVLMFSYAANIAGLLTSIPAITLGLFEAYAMISTKGLDLSNPVINTMLMHAGLNGLAVFSAIYNSLSKRNLKGLALRGVNAIVSVLMLGSALYVAFLSGRLVYTHRTGV
jgi:hypothetical protein